MAHVQEIDDGIGYGVQGQSTGALEAGNQAIGVWGVNSGTGIGVSGYGHPKALANQGGRWHSRERLCWTG